MKNNKGITLIALIITIIVMLILVAVTVSVVINSNLIGTAKKATQDYKAKEEGERNIAGFNVTIDGEEKYFNNAEEYVDYLKGNGGTTGGDDTTGGETTLVAGVYEPGATTPTYTWEQLTGDELIEGGVVHVDSNGVFTTNYEAGDTYESDSNSSIEFLDGKVLILPENVTKLGAEAFSTGDAGKWTIKGIESIGSNLKIVCSRAFANTQVEEIRLPEGVEVIEESADLNAWYEVKWYLPSSLTYIGMGNFSKGGNVYYSGTKEKWDAIEKDEIWLEPVNTLTVHFEDGTSCIYSSDFVEGNPVVKLLSEGM